METVEDRRSIFDRYPRSGIVHIEDDPSCGGSNPNLGGPSTAGIAAGIVDEHPDEAVDPRRIGLKKGRLQAFPMKTQRYPTGSGDRLKSVNTRLRVGGDIDVIPLEEPWTLVIHAGQPQEIVHDAAETAPFAGYARENRSIGVGTAGPAQCQVDFGFDHAQGCPQLVGSVSGELRLPSTHQLEWSGRPKPDHQSPRIHKDQDCDTNSGLRQEQGVLHPFDLTDALASNQPTGSKRYGLESE
jgi:hypothetical protein